MASRCRSVRAASPLCQILFTTVSVACGALPGELNRIPAEMFPDLRLLICATVATFFLAAMAGVYISLRTTQDQITARAESRAALDDSPITRISAAWPLPEPGRAAALRELAVIVKVSPPDSAEPANTTDRGEIQAVADPEQSSAPATIDAPPLASLNDASAPKAAGAIPEATGSTGIAAAPEANAALAADHAAMPSGIGETLKPANPKAGAGKERRPAVKKAQAAKKKAARSANRRRAIARVPDPVDPLASGYPLYLTVPVTN